MVIFDSTELPDIEYHFYVDKHGTIYDRKGNIVMGMVKIETKGSFGYTRNEFSAQEHGHAHAVAEAIEFLSNVVMHEAINLDHKLHEEGKHPSEGFDRG